MTTDRMCSSATSDENDVDGNVGIARREDQLALSLARRKGNGQREMRISPDLDGERERRPRHNTLTLQKERN